MTNRRLDEIRRRHSRVGRVRRLSAVAGGIVLFVACLYFALVTSALLWIFLPLGAVYWPCAYLQARRRRRRVRPYRIPTAGSAIAMTRRILGDIPSVNDHAGAAHGDRSGFKDTVLEQRSDRSGGA